ncbi:MAG: hypothetical protein AABX51_04740 [Nanoarchaeota archaeon]
MIEIDPIILEESKQIKNKLTEIKLQLSAKRKAGGYTGIAEIIIMGIPSKIKLFEIEGKPEQKDAIESQMKAAEDDLKTEYP